MAMITIGGIEFPGLSDFKIDTEPLGSFERNAKGLLVGDLIAIKTKLNCKWATLDNEYLSKLRSAAAPFFVKVKYLDTDGSYVTKEMYPSPQSASLAFVRDGKTVWKDVTINLIER